MQFKRIKAYVKPPNKGHFGDNSIINSHDLSVVERLSSSRRLKLYCYYRETEFSGSKNCPLYVERFINTVSKSQTSTTGGFTVLLVLSSIQEELV